jgi:hypothetical protein
LLAIARDKTPKDTAASASQKQSEQLDDDWVDIAPEQSNQGGGDDFDDLTLWVEIKKQVKILRDAIDDGDDDDKDGDENTA